MNLKFRRMTVMATLVMATLVMATLVMATLAVVILAVILAVVIPNLGVVLLLIYTTPDQCWSIRRSLSCILQAMPLIERHRRSYLN